MLSWDKTDISSFSDSEQLKQNSKIGLPKDLNVWIHNGQLPDCRKLYGELLLFVALVVVKAVFSFVLIIKNVIWENVKCSRVTDNAWESDSLELWNLLVETQTNDWQW